MMDIGTIVAGILTLCIFSFLYRDNPVYKMAESLLVGISIGYTLVIVWTTTLVDLMFTPLFESGELALIVPLILGLLMFARFSRRTAALSKIPLAVMIGSGAGVAIPVMLEARVIRQVKATIMPLVDSGGIPDFSAIVVLVGVITTLTYFYFSQKQISIMGKSARVGIYYLMIFFGTTFGYTVMSRMSTLIGRMEFLLSDFFHITG